jgi:hypothetical protein
VFKPVQLHLSSECRHPSSQKSLVIIHTPVSVTKVCAMTVAANVFVDDAPSCHGF